MKCSNCGREFGEGISCQYCGCDRVEGLGSFNGYKPGQGSGNVRGQEPPAVVHPAEGLGQMLCFNCGEVIPIDSDYCPRCGKPQYVNCPNCGYRYFAQYLYCKKCGTNREEYNKRREQERIEEENRRMAEARRREEELLKERKAAEERREKDAQYRRIMRRKDGFVLRNVCGEKVILGEGLDAVDFGKLVSLNDTAAWIWEQAGEQGEFCVYSLAKALCYVFDVDENTACSDIDGLLFQWRELGIVE